MKQKIVIILLLFFVAFTRLFKLGQIPNSYTPDELSQGYTAYSILLTHKDEWGAYLPIRPSSYGDYKPPLQTYILIPFIHYFGLNTYAVRLPNAIFSILGVWGFYLLAKKFTKDKFALLATFFYALSPGILGMGRIALEANIMLTLIIWGVYLLSSLNLYSVVIGSSLLGLSLFTYHSSKIFVPLFLIYYFLEKKTSKIFFVAFTIITLFFALNFLTEIYGANRRATDIIVTSPTDNWEHVDTNRYESVAGGGKPKISNFFENKTIYTFDTIFRNIFTYFSPQFLLTEGAGEGSYGILGGFGILQPLIFFGLLISLAKLNNSQHKKLLFLTFIGLLPSALTKGYLPANRAIICIPFFFLLGALGVEIFSKKIPKWFFNSLLFISAILVIKFLYTYFTLSNLILAKDMLYGHQQISEYIKSLPQSPTHIVYSRSLSEPQTYAMFFDKTDPAIIQSASIDWKAQMKKTNAKFLDQLGEYSFGNYIFKELRNEDFQREDTLLIGKESEFAGKKPSYIINYPGILKTRPAIYLLYLGKKDEQ